MDQSYSNASNSEPHFNGGDWSPRISFSHSFACIQRIPSPTKKSPLHDSEFEFSRSVSTDLLSADELFCNGKLRPLKLGSHECGHGKREWKASQRRQEVHIMGSSSIKKGGVQATCDGNVPSSKEEAISVCTEDSISRWEQNGYRRQKIESNAGKAKSPTSSREEPISVCGRAEKVEIGKRPVELISPTSRKECLSSVDRTAEKLVEDGKATCTLRSRTSREGLICACKLQMGGKARSPTSRKELIMSLQKQEMGENVGKSRSPTGREELIPACKLDISSKAGNKLEYSRTSREDVMFACKRVENIQLKGKAEEIKVPTSKEDLLSIGSASQKSEKGGTPVRWREELLWAKRNEEEEHANANSHLRRFSKNPRSASMIIEGSWKLGNRTCISLNSSRCQSPSRSFSLPSTTPASPSASSSISGFATSSFSSSSKYRSKIKDFFKLRKLTVAKEETLHHPPDSSSSTSTCRLPLSPRSLLAFFKSKESSKAGSKSSSSMHEVTNQAHEHVCASTRNLYSAAHKDNSANKSKDLKSLPHSQINSSINKELISISCLTLPNSAKPPPINPSFPFHFPPSSTSKVAVSTMSTTTTIEKTTQQHSSAECAVVGGGGGSSKLRAQKSRSLSNVEKVVGIEGPTMLVIDEGLWEEGNMKSSNNNALNLHTNGPSKQGSPRIKKQERGNMMMGGGSKGGAHVRPKGLERPLPYTSSVRVTPVLNVPSCITPSLIRKTKSLSKPKAFRFENLFSRREKSFDNKSSEG